MAVCVQAIGLVEWVCFVCVRLLLFFSALSML